MTTTLVQSSEMPKSALAQLARAQIAQTDDLKAGRQARLAQAKYWRFVRDAIANPLTSDLADELIVAAEAAEVGVMKVGGAEREIQRHIAVGVELADLLAAPDLLADLAKKLDGPSRELLNFDVETYRHVRTFELQVEKNRLTGGAEVQIWRRKGEITAGREPERRKIVEKFNSAADQITSARRQTKTHSANSRPIPPPRLRWRRR